VVVPIDALQVVLEAPVVPDLSDDALRRAGDAAVAESQRAEIIAACAGVPEMLRTLVADRQAGAVSDAALRQAKRVEALLTRWTA
jgi:hypothetical protein